MSLYKLIWNIGAWYRNPSVLRLYIQLRKSEQLNNADLEALQFTKLKETLVFAQQHSKFYAQKFAEVNFIPETDFICIADIKKVPVIEKSDLLQHNNNIHSTFQFKKVFKSETSGTSGQVLKFNKDEYWDSFNRASIMRGYAWHGVNMWDKNGYFWGYNIDARKKTKNTVIG